MLLNSFTHIALGILDRFPIAQATGQGGTIGHIPVVFSFFLNDDLKRVIFHGLSSPRRKYRTSLSDPENTVRLAMEKLILSELGHLVKALSR
jgi:hypothetical protein